jgi:hypothetical protein
VLNIPDVIVPESPVVITVPVTFGRVIVLSAVGLTTVRVVSYASSDDPSNIIVPPVVTFMVEEFTTPVIGPVNAVALTVPDTSNFVVGVVVPIPILLALASMYIAVTLVPPSLTLKVKSASAIKLAKCTPCASTNTLKSLSAPTINPESFKTPNVPDVVSFALDLKKFAADMPPRASESVAVPVNLNPAIAVERLIPFVIVANPDIASFGVKEVSLIIAILLLLL